MPAKIIEIGIDICWRCGRKVFFLFWTWQTLQLLQLLFLLLAIAEVLKFYYSQSYTVGVVHNCLNSVADAN